MCPPKVLNQDVHGRRVIVTGANSGIGFVTAKQLAKQGASVTLACRNEGEGSARVDEIRAEFPNADLEVHRLDLGDLSSVRAFVVQAPACRLSSPHKPSEPPTHKHDSSINFIFTNVQYSGYNHQ